MKKILATAGMAALGAASINAATPPTLLPQEQSKPWSVSASLRGFYDDNYLTVNNDRQDSFGLEFSPSIMANIIKEQTQLYASYKFGLKYYEDRSDNNTDYSHLANVLLNHDFSERYRLTVYDDFAIADEPMLMNTDQAVQVLRVDGTNMRNIAGADFKAQVAEKFALEPGYSFSFYDYDQEGAGSYSAALDRNEHLAKLAFRWVGMMDRTDGLVGYHFQKTSHTSDDTLDPSGATYLSPELRDTDSHFYFVGADYSASARLTLNGRVGGQTVVYNNSTDNQTSPYLDLSATYRFQEASTLQAGYKLQRMTTDWIGYTGGGSENLTVDQLANFFYARVSHTISRLTLSGGAQYQYGEFQGGSVDGQQEGFLSMDISATYKLNPFLAAETGYAYDWLKDYGWSASAERGYTRNYVYLGLKATY